jgi:hypothetical protein
MSDAMNALMPLLRTARDARKQAAQRRLAAAQAQVAQAQGQAAEAQAAVVQARDARDQLLGGRGAGLQRDWRDTVLPSCLALIAQCQAAVASAQQKVSSAVEALAKERAALNTCERALLRTDALQELLDGEVKDLEARAEQLLDEDLALTHGGRTHGVGGVGDPGDLAGEGGTWT